MNILILTNHLKIGGSSTQILKLSKSLDKSHKIYIVSNGGELVSELKKIKNTQHKKLFMPVLGSKDQGEKPLVRMWPYYKYLWRKFGFKGFKNSLKTLSVVINIINKEKINLIYANQPGPTTIAHFASLWTHCPFIFHVRGVLSNEFPPLFWRRVSQGAKKIFAESPEIKKRLSRIYRISKEKIEIMGHFIDRKRFKPKGKNELMNFGKKIGLKKNKKIISHISTLSERKIAPVEALISAAPELIQKNNIQIVIVGGGPLLEKIKKKAEAVNRKIKKEVILVPGMIIDTDKIINLSDIVVGTGTVFEEATLCKKPFIIASNYGFGGPANYKTLERFKPSNLTGRGLGTKVDKNKMLNSIETILKNDKKEKILVEEQTNFIKDYYGDPVKKFIAIAKDVIRD